VFAPRYSVSQVSVGSLLAFVESGDIAIPEIQRPFVWQPTDVRDFLDSLLKGYPVGYLIAWHNHDVRLKNGRASAGKRILIDGQQRVTALMAALLGREVVNKDYESVRIRIAFHPVTQEFKVCDAATGKDPAWLRDVAVVFDPLTSLLGVVDSHCARNPGITRDEVHRSVERLRAIMANQLGLVELAPDLDIEQVAEIFARVNSKGVPLSEADFAMAKIAVHEKHGGGVLRKAIDYFCHLAVRPEAYANLSKDAEFARSEFWPKIAWLRNEKDDLYDPSYSDMLRVAFTSEFRRGRLKDLVALLSGRNFETKQYEEAVVEDSFARLSDGIKGFVNEENFKNLVMIIRSAGFVDAGLVGSQSALNVAYILYLTLRRQGLPVPDIQRRVARWFVLSLLTGRYSGSLESTIDDDIRHIHARGIDSYAEEVIRAELSGAFWDAGLPLALDTASVSSPYFRIFQAAQVKLNDRGFLSRDTPVRELVEHKADVHHIFPRGFLMKNGVPRSQYNQIANCVLAESAINRAIGDTEPQVCFKQLIQQCQQGAPRYGTITDIEGLRENFRMNCIPDGIEEMTVQDYPAFLVARRKLMAQKIKAYFEGL
jgi:hypothetical protein